MRGTRVAIALFFFGDGLLLGSWASRIPAVQRHADLTNVRLGLALFAASLGALVAMPVAGWLCARIGSRSVTVVALFCGSTSLFLTSVARGLGGRPPPLVALGAGLGPINGAPHAPGP